MGESLFGKLRDVMSREKTSDIADQGSVINTTANLARIGLATATQPATTIPRQDSPVSGSLTIATQSSIPQAHVEQVGIQFFAELPNQGSVNEIMEISRHADNCLSAESKMVGDGVWQVAVTLSMAPVPQEIHTVEATLQTWAQKMGGTSKGWGLSQNQAA